MGSAALIPEQRREMIMRQLRQHQMLGVHQLTELLGCSHMTVRRDIVELEKSGRAYAIHGGVRIASHLVTEPSHQIKHATEQPLKRSIAAHVARLVKPGMTIYLDAGTTTACLVPHLVGLGELTVITNDFRIVLALADSPQITVVHTGGTLDGANGSAIGPLAAATIRKMTFDIALVSTSSWDLDRGTTTPLLAKVEVKQAAMALASQRVLLATSAKYGMYGTYRVAELAEFDLIVTDDRMSEAAVQRMREAGLEVAVALSEPQAVDAAASVPPRAQR